MPDTYISESLSAQEIREELDRLLQSAIFSQSDRLGRFLRFAIEQAIAGNADRLKEYVIGTEVYDRKPPYHPSQDSIVRTEARRLRAKLKEYYESEGKDNPVFIYFRPGAYLPLFRRNEMSVAAKIDGTFSGTFPANDLLVKGAGVAVAVLPLEDLSGRPLSALCAQGVTDELIHNLTRTEGIRVIARPPHSTEGLLDIPVLSQKLGINTVIEGTVREDLDRLRITVRVLGADGFQISSHRFETEATAEALAQVQEQVATAFVSRARPEQSLIRRRKASPGALTFAAYPLVMHAETLLDEGSSSNLPAALLKFQEARDLVPSYSRSYCGIAHCRLDMALRGASPSASLISLAKQDALRAIELDPETIESYSCLAGAQALAWEWEEAEKNFQRALSLGTHVSASRRYGLYLTALKRFDEASHHFEIAQRIDPFSNRQKVVHAKFFHLTRRFEEGLRQLSERALYGPLPVEARFFLALMSAHLGRNEQAEKLVESIRSVSAGQLPMMAGIAEVLALIGEREQADRIVQGFRLLAPDAAISRSRQALLALALGNTESAISFLLLAAEDREPELVWIGVDPRFDPIRQTISFHEIEREVLPESL
ncbi:TolB-like protein [Silvibacterium bohemicum]|uniref:TolB-like protein n=1 Tax=Silvibacterium bohemicum TaxID=1577686 RepID=A0A841JXM9_9BACT|nr:tetratricopeptide repeat protein [Silvibacterium bohemicum]MBB6143198.1 TolB-like protein [Silvibacterium bohemicum]